MESMVIEGLAKAFGDKVVLRDFSAVFPAGKVSCIMAPSGAGKTTLLRILMGLEQPDKGRISGLAGRKKSAIFQEDRLCEHLSALSNIRLVRPALRRQQVLEAMASMGLYDCADQSVGELSGGMRRRVSLLRALLSDYEILFLDEPFKGLDMQTKDAVMGETRKRSTGRTVLLVTHDLAEAQAMGAQQTIFLKKEDGSNAQI